MVEVLVYPLLQDPADQGEIGHHGLIVERGRGDLDFDAAVVAMQVGALPLIAEKSVSVAEMDAFGDPVHAREPQP